MEETVDVEIVEKFQTKLPRPKLDRLLVKTVKGPAKTESGLDLPDSKGKDAPVEGDVILVGPGKFDELGNRIPMDYIPGQRVVYTQYAGTEIMTDDGEKLLIISEKDVLAAY